MRELMQVRSEKYKYLKMVEAGAVGIFRRIENT